MFTFRRLKFVAERSEARPSRRERSELKGTKRARTGRSKPITLK
ncbi:MAG: hypothetical protein ACFFAH_03570 [Promethearchaeota archaeon]